LLYSPLPILAQLLHRVALVVRTANIIVKDCVEPVQLCSLVKTGILLRSVLQRGIVIIVLRPMIVVCAIPVVPAIVCAEHIRRVDIVRLMTRRQTIVRPIINAPTLVLLVIMVII